MLLCCKAVDAGHSLWSWAAEVPVLVCYFSVAACASDGNSAAASSGKLGGLKESKRFKE